MSALTIGERWEFGLSITDGSGAPLDLTGATVTMRVAIWKGKPALSTATTTLGNQTDARGTASAVFLPATTAGFNFPGDSLYYQVWVSFDSENQKLVADGTLVVQKAL